MSFKVLRTSRFNDELQDIVLYIKNEFTLDEAIDYLNYFEEQVTNLSIFPKIGLIPRNESIAKQGYRVLVSKKNLIFYKINSSNETITLHSIVSAKQDYVDLI